jgi:hypothetical protein
MMHDAIYALYPNVVTIRNETAYDVNENEVKYDKTLTAAKAVELQAIEAAKAQAIIDARQSALNKLMALGLTEEEALALGVK